MAASPTAWKTHGGTLASESEGRDYYLIENPIAHFASLAVDRDCGTISHMSDTIILTPASNLLPGDLIDFYGDEYVDLPDHCMVCGMPAKWTPEVEWTHEDASLDYDPATGGGHLVLEAPRDMSLDSEGVRVGRIFTDTTFAAARAAAHARGESDYVSGLGEHLAPMPGQVAIHTSEDGWIILPTGHEVKVISRDGPESVDYVCPICDAEHPEDADLEAQSRMLDRIGLNPDTGGECPSYGELADAQGRVDEMVTEYGCIVKVIDLLSEQER